MPSPIDDIEADFLWHQLFVFGPSVAGAESTDSLLQNKHVEIDSKAQRILKGNEVMAFIWDGLVLAGAPTADGIAAVRSGLLLP